MQITRSLSNIIYSYPSLDILSVFYDVPSFLYNVLDNNALEEIARDKSAVKKYEQLLFKKMLGNRQIISGLTDSRQILPNFAVDFVKSFNVSNNVDNILVKDGVYITIPLKGVFNFIVKKQRGAIFEGQLVLNGNLDKFKLYSIADSYGLEDYSIAFREVNNTFGIALYYTQISSIRNKPSLLLICYDDKNAYIDDISKYRDITGLGPMI